MSTMHHEVSAELLVPLAKLVEMVNSGKFSGYVITVDGDRPVRVPVSIVVSSEPIYVSRDSERVVVDGHVVAWLPPEPDHGPDGWTPPVSEARAFGYGVRREVLVELLDAAVGQAIVVERFRDQAEKLTGWRPA